METLGWNPLLDERSHASSLMFPGYSTATTSSRPTSQSVSHNFTKPQPLRQPPQSANYSNRNSVKFSFNLSEFGDEVDSLLPLPSPAFSISPGVFFDEPFTFPNAGDLNRASAASQRSPSLGIGSSLGHNETVAGSTYDDSFRPSSVAHFNFPRSGAELPYDGARAKSALPGSRPTSSADWRDDDSNGLDNEDPNSEHWTDWNIKTAPGCPPLEQLFENKRRWREKFNQSVPPPLQRHCVFCKSISKPPSIYLSHAIRDAKGEITCPVLNAYNCPKCGKRGHTVRYCALNQSHPSSQSPLPTAVLGSGSFNAHTERFGSVSSGYQSADMMSGRSSKSSLGFY